MLIHWKELISLVELQKKIGWLLTEFPSLLYTQAVWATVSLNREEKKGTALKKVAP